MCSTSALEGGLGSNYRRSCPGPPQKCAAGCVPHSTSSEKRAYLGRVFCCKGDESKSSKPGQSIGMLNSPKANKFSLERAIAQYALSCRKLEARVGQMHGIGFIQSALAHLAKSKASEFQIARQGKRVAL